MGSASSVATYEIDRSLRWDPPVHTNFKLTPSSAGNLKRWTISMWIKRSGLGSYMGLLGVGSFTSGSTWSGLYLNSNDTLTLFDGISGNSFNYTTNAQLKDTTAWYHIVGCLDAANTVGNIWINGVEASMGTATAPVDTNYQFLGTNEHYIGRENGGYYFNGYIAEINVIDGLYLGADSFGETDSTTGAWVPKEYSGSYGSEGYYLNFSDNSALTSGALGADSSGNGNNWTPYNFGLSAGTGNDSLTDTPTNNYCTWNILDYVDGGFGTSWGANARTANGALEMTAGGKNTLWHGTFFKSSGKWYYESTGWNNDTVKGGWGRSATSAGTEFLNANCFLLNQNGQFQSNNPTGAAGGTTYGGSISSTDTIGCAIDLDNNTVAWSVNGQWGDGSGNWDETYDNANKISITAGEWTPTHTHGHSSSGQCFANFGQRPFANDPPSGFKTLCASNIDTPLIKKGTDYFNTMVYTGDGAASRTIPHGLKSTPNLWIGKTRSVTQDWIVSDSYRGVANYMNWNGPGVDAAYGSISWNGTAPNATNITVGENGGGWGTNQNGATQVLYAWVEDANAGFDIVSYQGNATAGNTIAHSLNDKPDLIMCKNRDHTTNWMTYVSHATAEKFMYINEDDDLFDDVAAWNDTEPNQSVFTTHADQQNNGAAPDDLIAYLWTSVPGYSKIGTYIGNGNAEGKFVYTGFKPAFILLKRTSADASWVVHDNKRAGYNGDNDYLHTDLSQAESDGSSGTLDLLANGFKLRMSAGTHNDGTFIYMAFAETSFKYANAR